MNLLNIRLILRTWKGNKLFLSVALISLAIGLACALLLFTFIFSEYKIVKGPHKDPGIFLLKSDYPMDNTKSETTSYILSQLPPLLKENYSQVTDYCRFQEVPALFETGAYRSDKLMLLRADSTVLQFFNLSVLSGNIRQTLSRPDEAAITKSLSYRLFGDDNPIGKTFSINSKNVITHHRITSIINDSEFTTFLKFDVLLPMDIKNYFGGVTFIKLSSGTSPGSFIEEINKNSSLPRLTSDCNYYIQTFEETYFDKTETLTNWGFLLKRDKSFIHVGIISALAILFIACFNFINLSLVRSFSQEKLCSIQKIFGSGLKNIRMLLLTENLLLVSSGFLLSLGLLFLAFPVFNQLFDAHLTTSSLLNFRILLVSVGLILFLVIAPLVYVLPRLQGSTVIRGLKSVSGNRGTPVLRVMVILQFAISIVLISSVMLFKKQLLFITHTANYDDNVIELFADKIPYSEVSAFKNDVLQLAGIEAGTVSNTNFLNAWIMQTDEVPILLMEFDNGFMETHHLSLIEGEPLTGDYSNNTERVMVNETLVKTYNLKNPVGQILPEFQKKLTIAGVVSDFYTESFDKKIKPTVINLIHPDEKIRSVQLRIASHAIAPALEQVKSIWTQHFPDKLFSYTFLKEQFNQLHSDADRLFKIVGFFTLISILLNGFGIFGITWYSVERRTKEIGIRKVNGSTRSEILSLLNKKFIIWVVIAFTLALPVSWVLLNYWLQNFVYKTTLSWWIFALAGVLALAVGLLTVSWQSLKAANKNPVEALRYE